MANISLTSKYVNQRYYGSGHGSSNGITSKLAQTNAYNAGQSASLNWGTPSTQTGNSYIGKVENRTVETGTPEYVSELNYYSCTYNVTATAYLYQVHLEFDISGLNSSNVESATLTINSSGTSTISYYICAPNSSSSNINDSTYYTYDNGVFSATRASFEQNTTSKSIDITSQLKQCINTNKGIIVITPAAKTPGYSSRLSGLSYTLSYTEALTPCGAPTSISDNGTGYIVPNGNIKLKWSGATAGNNNAITGYRIYWKQGGAPTTSSYTGYYNTSNIATSCTFSSATSGSMPTTRGKTYYFKILTIGQQLNSSLSSTQVSLKVNQLPAIPIISVNYDRFKSTGGSVVFTVNPGADGDSGQTKNVYYSTSLSGTKTKITGSTFTTNNLTDNTTFYFWTYDGYEYSTNNFSKEIKKNTAPELGTVTLSINSSTTLFNNFNIDGSCTSETCDTNGRIVSRRWELYLNGGETIIVPNANTLSGFSNFNIVNNSHITFGQIYRIRYIITDDIGETATKASAARTFPTPNINLYSKDDGDIAEKFGSKLYLKYNTISSYVAPYGFNEVKLYYKLSSEASWNNNITLSNNTSSNLDAREEINCNNLTYGQEYNFKIRFTLSNSSSTEIDLGTKTKSIALNPNIAIAGICYPFENRLDNTNNFSFSYQNNSLNNKIFKYYINNIEINSSYYNEEISNLGRIISLDLPNIPTSVWQNYIGNGYTLNNFYSKELKVKIIDEFGDSYTGIKNWTFDFSNSLLSDISASIQIKDINNNYNNFPSDYSLFENQELKVTFNNLKSYCSETVTLTLKDNLGIQYSTLTLNLSVSGVGIRPEYTSNNNNFTFIIPKITVNNKNNSYFILEIENGSKQQILYVNIKENEKFIISRCNTDAIDLQIIKVEKNGNNYNFTCQITDFGGYGLAPYKDKYSEIKLNIYYSNSYDGSYSNFASNIDITNSSIVDNIFTINNISSMVTLSGEKVYFKPEIIVTNNFQKINNVVPFGAASHTKSYNDTTYYIFYNSVPNLAYGKNFFLINTTDVGSHNDQVLIIRPISNQKVIYFGETGNEATITMNNNNIILDNFIINGVIADGATIECGTWDQS